MATRVFCGYDIKFNVLFEELLLGTGDGSLLWKIYSRQVLSAW